VNDIKPGLHFDLPETDYHGHQGSLSVTGAKTLLRAPALYKWQREHPVHKDVFDFGKAAHQRVLGVGAQVTRLDFDSWRTKAAQEARDAERAAGRVPLLGADFERVQAMADALREHTLAAQLLGAGEPEVSAFCADEPTGVMRRSRFDWIEPTRILVDYKTTVCSEPSAFARSAATFGYHMQAAWYLDIADDLDLEPRGFLFIAQEKEAPYLVSVVELTADALEVGRARNRRALQMYRDCSESGIWPGYTPDTDITPIDLPAWAYREEPA
jgi:hypothetical protein